MPINVHSVALQRAAELLGGKVKLRERLRVPMSELENWLAGVVAPPLDAFLKAVDVISSHQGNPVEADTATLPPSAARIAIETSLDAALRATGADMGNVQLLYPDGLRIVAQRGFRQPFLEFFARVNHEGSCGAAKQEGRRVVVADVSSDPIFAGTVAAEIMAQARVRACQSTPLVASSGRLLGMVNTHFAEAGAPDENDLRALDRIARRAARWLEAGA